MTHYERVRSTLAHHFGRILFISEVVFAHSPPEFSRRDLASRNGEP